MDYIKIQTEFIKDRLNKKNKMKLCYDYLKERFGILNAGGTMFIMIPEDSFVIQDLTTIGAFNITSCLSDFDENSEVTIDHYDKTDKQMIAILSNGTKASVKLMDYFKGCKFYNVGFKNIIYAVEDDIVVGGVLPIR